MFGIIPKPSKKCNRKTANRNYISSTHFRQICFKNIILLRKTGIILVQRNQIQTVILVFKKGIQNLWDAFQTQFSSDITPKESH